MDTIHVNVEVTVKDGKVTLGTLYGHKGEAAKLQAVFKAICGSDNFKPVSCVSTPEGPKQESALLTFSL